ncbi:hypothetical protein BSF41_24450 [Flavobacterium sp. ACN2]|uniref:hypothetical protein n=1 Tax=Flavobacterium sp. ACN2 TaxID=1975676 RepID=UPI000BB3A8E7|nr:hypothetical protein [Flavobacterium sp. ACN2]PBI89076.1 hypothetical protein BSF41_24450 [Flavobacterium sp. ACN2]
MIEFGPVIAIVDDKKDEVQGIIDYLSSQDIGFRYFDADIDESNFPEKQIESVELIFLDLYYSSAFDPYQCAQWIDEIIPSKKQYELVVWSRDSHRTEELLSVLTEINKFPRFCITKQKSEIYETPDGIQKLINEVKNEINENKNVRVDEFLAEIIDFSEEHVILNCLIDQKSDFFQIRKFEKTPLTHFLKFDVGTILMVKVTTSKGERLFEYIEQFEDYSDLFEQKNIFDKFKDSPLTRD